jgi:RNA polymerase primary sigma factor
MSSTIKNARKIPSDAKYDLALQDFPLLTHDEHIALMEKIYLGDEAARELMILSNMRLVIFFSQKYLGRGLELSDLIQEGTFGLVTAISKFDISRGFKFSTHASWWIKKSLQLAVHRYGKTIRVPLEVSEFAVSLEIAEAELQMHLGRTPLDHELDELTGLSKEKRLSYKNIPKTTFSLDKPMDSEASFTLADIYISDIDDFIIDVEKRMVGETVKEAVGELDSLSKNVLELRYGLTGYTPMNQKNAAEQLGITVKKLKQVEADAIATLKNVNDLSMLLVDA